MAQWCHLLVNVDYCNSSVFTGVLEIPIAMYWTRLVTRSNASVSLCNIQTLTVPLKIHTILLPTQLNVNFEGCMNMKCMIRLTDLQQINWLNYITTLVLVLFYQYYCHWDTNSSVIGHSYPSITHWSAPSIGPPTFVMTHSNDREKICNELIPAVSCCDSVLLEGSPHMFLTGTNFSPCHVFTTVLPWQ
jgi:hypothetical protein